MTYNSRRNLQAIICLLFCTLIQCSPIVRNSNSSDSSNDDDSLLALYNMFGGGNPRTTPDGSRIVEGDIVTNSEDIPAPRKAIPDTSLYWPNAEVIYTFHDSIKDGERAVIEASMQHWSQHTCIKFRQRQAGDHLFVRFRSDTQGCWSLVGRQTDRYGYGQDVSIGPGCANLNTVVHEIGHVIGFYHEQSRSDRDQYIDIVWGNVLPGYALQFRKESDSNHNIPYDITSTMQYPQWAFSKEIFEKSTIVARNPAYQRFLSKNYPLSFRDRMLANEMYSCTTPCSSSGCQNGGYLRATASSNLDGLSSAGQCSCDCPPNYTGSQCETALREDYYPSLPCGGIVTGPGRIETPGYPQRTEPGMSCMWDIRAPADKKVRIQFEGFEFAPRFTKAGTKVINKCFNETVEIRLKNSNIYDGDTYCGTDLIPGTILKSDGPRAVIIITANSKMVGKGLSAIVKFSKDDEDDQDMSTRPMTEPTTQTLIPATEEWTTPKPFINTLPPVLPPQPPPVVVTTSSLLEEYEKESKKTLPPVFPM